MNLTPLPHQLEGAAFLASRKGALLADAPRVGKTGAAIIGSDLIFARQILVVTKSSARAQWGYEFKQWSNSTRKIQVIYSSKAKVDPSAEVVVVGWGMVFSPALLKQLASRRWCLMILDESHEAKTPGTKRTTAVYDVLANHAAAIWCLSGTPIPNAPCDLHPMLDALDHSLLRANPERGWPDVRSYEDFMHHYCVVRRKFIGGAWRSFAIKGRNEEELRARLKNLWLRRTQSDVGIQPPIYSVFALHIDKLPPELTGSDAQAVLDALETDTHVEDMHLGTIRRVTGQIMAPAVIEAAKEFLDDNPDEKLVLMAWHTDVIDMLREGLKSYGVVGIDGRTPPTARRGEEQAFLTDLLKRVFVGQILAAGEAIDLSSAAELWFAEISLVPKDMAQAALRITNHSQKRQALVRVCALAGSITEALFSILTRKVESITKIMEK